MFNFFHYICENKLQIDYGRIHTHIAGYERLYPYQVSKNFSKLLRVQRSGL